MIYLTIHTQLSLIAFYNAIANSKCKGIINVTCVFVQHEEEEWSIQNNLLHCHARKHHCSWLRGETRNGLFSATCVWGFSIKCSCLNLAVWPPSMILFQAPNTKLLLNSYDISVLLWCYAFHLKKYKILHLFATAPCKTGYLMGYSTLKILSFL